MNKRIGRMPKGNPEKVYERADGLCESYCGRAGAQTHHRKFLSRHGGHNIANLVWLCVGCHQRAHGIGDPAGYGWAISRYEERPECEVVFIDDSGRGWLFDDDGNKKETDVTPY